MQIQGTETNEKQEKQKRNKIETKQKRGKKRSLQNRSQPGSHFCNLKNTTNTSHSEKIKYKKTHI